MERIWKNANPPMIAMTRNRKETIAKSLALIDSLESACMTGVGGGSLMTPLLILLFGIHPSTAVGTDLLYAAATKTGGTVMHGFAHSIHWPAVVRLACGSMPASIADAARAVATRSRGCGRANLVNVVLGFALLLTAALLIFRKRSWPAMARGWSGSTRDHRARDHRHRRGAGRAGLDFVGRRWRGRRHRAHAALPATADGAHRRL